MLQESVPFIQAMLGRLFSLKLPSANFVKEEKKDSTLLPQHIAYEQVFTILSSDCLSQLWRKKGIILIKLEVAICDKPPVSTKSAPPFHGNTITVPKKTLSKIKTKIILSSRIFRTIHTQAAVQPGAKEERTTVPEL